MGNQITNDVLQSTIDNCNKLLPDGIAFAKEGSMGKMNIYVLRNGRRTKRLYSGSKQACYDALWLWYEMQYQAEDARKQAAKDIMLKDITEDSTLAEAKQALSNEYELATQEGRESDKDWYRQRRNYVDAMINTTK